MRLWHQLLISKLPRQQLLGQHRECCALRGKGWGRKHSVVDYVFKHDPDYLVAYHYLIMDEMKQRGYHPDEIWYNSDWRGTTLGEHSGWTNPKAIGSYLIRSQINKDLITIYPEHNDEYLQECIDNLKEKGIEIQL